MEVKFATQPKVGVNYIINIHVFNKIRDIRDTPGPEHSLYNLIEGKETWGSILRPPVMAIARANDNGVFYQFYGTEKADITRYEVLDYSEKAGHGCTPVVAHGGLLENHIELKCKEKPRHEAKFLIKLYILSDERSLREIKGETPGQKAALLGARKHKKV